MENGWFYRLKGDAFWALKKIRVYEICPTPSVNFHKKSSILIAIYKLWTPIKIEYYFPISLKLHWNDRNNPEWHEEWLPAYFLVLISSCASWRNELLANVWKTFVVRGKSKHCCHRLFFLSVLRRRPVKSLLPVSHSPSRKCIFTAFFQPTGARSSAGKCLRGNSSARRPPASKACSTPSSSLALGEANKSIFRPG